MKKIISLCFILIGFASIAQNYTWSTGTDPGWTSSDGNFQYNSACGNIGSSCTGNYPNNMNSFYTSPTLVNSCAGGTNVLKLRYLGNMEVGHDWMAIEYSMDDGATWINPNGPFTVYTGHTSGQALNQFVDIPSGFNKLRLNVYSDGAGTGTGYKIIGIECTCPVIPVYLVSFSGVNNASSNEVSFLTQDEIPGSVFRCYRSTISDPFTWDEIAVIFMNGSLNYSFSDTLYQPGENVYHIVMVAPGNVTTTFPDMDFTITN